MKNNIKKFLFVLASLIILTLTLISLSVVSDTKTFDNEKLEQLKIYLDEKNYDWEEILNQ
ncbi:MAG: hypothetical protein IIZ99_02405 [Turicibacter sp.]|nr:hypothetical protein [Turicibacter sp.]